MRFHSDFERVRDAWGDPRNRAAIRRILLNLADAPDGTLPGLEEMIEAVEQTPGANRADVEFYFGYRPPAAAGA